MDSDKEYRLLDILARDPSSSQRRVAEESGLSLGMVNLVLRRMVKTGYIKVSALNGRTARYVITPKGSAELARRSYEYLLHVISSFRELRDGISRLVEELYAEGTRRIIIYGSGDVADIAALACASPRLVGLHVVQQAGGVLPESAKDAAVLDCRVDVATGDAKGIHVLRRIARAKSAPPSRS